MRPIETGTAELGDVDGLRGALAHGATAVVRRSGPERGLMTPLYALDAEESFHVLAGSITVFIGARSVRLGAGDAVSAPRLAERAVRIESDGASWLSASRVRSAARYDDFGRAVGAATRAWATPEDEATVRAIAGENGIRILGAPGALPS
ncbi:MAG: hypothetical protein ICV74_10325 [Thermoleophilia bacterium]|nr:hypothetical protein [Thermoleophilia bacterium]